MAKLRVNWAPARLMTFEEVLEKPGYYLNGISGDIYRHDEVPQATVESVATIEKHSKEGGHDLEVDPYIWLFITSDLELTEGDVRSMLRDYFQVRMEDQGRFVSTGVWRRP